LFKKCKLGEERRLKMKIKSVYVAGALTGASEIYKDFLKAVVLGLETEITVNRFFSFELLINPSIVGENIYVFNDGQILKSDALVAFCDYPSTGMGMEIMMAHQVGKKIIFLHGIDSQPARMLLEFASELGYPILRYSGIESVSDIVRRILIRVNP